MLLTLAEVPYVLDGLALFERVRIMDAATATCWCEAVRILAAELAEPIGE
ncbi:MAG TPA: hypothetical protein VFV19_13585 [Candidatus Polarisedimenticolaceae bacterium]|nr:hypothetical protein [Candidatus Polarisedimenticolaceae bacterium]